MFIFWKKARIPTRNRCHCLKALKKLYELYEKLRGLGKNKMRNNELRKKREQEFQESLEDLFDIGHANALEIIKIEEDKKFLLLQRQKGRPGCMLGKDMRLAGVEQRKAVRIQKENDRREKHCSRIPETEQIYYSSSSEEIDNEGLECITTESVGHCPELPGPSGIKRARRETLTPRISAVLDKCKISDRDAVHLLAACVEAFSPNPAEFILNRTSFRRTRQNYRKSSACKIKSKFFDLNLEFVVIHWDSKLLPNLTGREKVDRLAIIATAPNVEQLLGVPELSSGSGNEVSSAVYDTREDWSLLQKVQAFVFDTTASNTGRLNGANVLLQQKLDRDILLLPCRHHIYELVLQGVFAKAGFSSSSGPDVALFKRFKNNWANINQTKFSPWTTDVKVYEILKDEAREILAFAERKLQDDYPRDDYREFLELIVIFLGGLPAKGTKFRQPGAYHLARWMAKGIYCLKIWLFRKEFKLQAREETALQKICCFIVKCYAQAWFSAPESIQAPLNDIIFMKKLEAYKNHDGEIAIAAQKKFLNHLWYLNEECSALALFDERLNSEQKRKMVNKIMHKEESEDEGEGEIEEVARNKLCVKLENVSNFICEDLPEQLLSPKSLKLFERFKLPTEFLLIDPTHWKERQDYKQGQEIMGTLKVVNDAAERGVKLMEEFNDKITKDEEQKQFLLQVAQDYRGKYPGHSREILKATYD